MTVMFCHNADVDVAGENLLCSITFNIESGDKVGIIGPNGVGKTTLIKALIGEFPVTQGSVGCNVSWGYLPQKPEDNAKETGSIFEAVLSERQDILEMRNSLRFLEYRMSREADSKVMEQYSLLMEKYEVNGGYALEALTRKILSGLGFDDFEKNCLQLSGGQKTRLALGKLLIKEPELLILDEPTNYLDIDALEWLESYLANYPGTLMMVSHDRYFLDRVVNKILFVNRSTVKIYKGNYTEFELQYALEQKTLMKEAEKTERKIASLEEYIRRNKAGVNAKQARGREKQLHRMKSVQTKESKNKISFSLEAGRSGDIVLDLAEVAVSYGWKKILENVNLQLRRGDKLAVLGENGVGKTSLLKAILGKLSYQGTIRKGANVQIAYFSQEHEDIGAAETVIDEIRSSFKYEDPEIRSILARFGFSGDDVFKATAVLSGGEKSRLALCKLFLTEGNLLLLDEPTNHLDMETIGILEENLADYEGTVIVISHDRYFLNRTVNKVAVLTAQGLRTINGSYTDYRDWLKKESQNEEEKTEQTDKLRHEESKLLKKKEKRIQKMEEQIISYEQELKDLEGRMEEAANDYEKIMGLTEEHQQIEARLNEMLAEWMENVD